MTRDGGLSLGRAMKSIRVASGLSQRRLAEKLAVDPTYISHLESDRRDPSVRLLRRFAALTEVPVGSLLVIALWDELDSRERATFQPLVSSLTRLAGVVARNADG